MLVAEVTLLDVVGDGVIEIIVPLRAYGWVTDFMSDKSPPGATPAPVIPALA
jgi:hypothetical protein